MFSAMICNPTLNLRLEHEAIGAGQRARREHAVQQLRGQAQRLPLPQGHVDFGLRPA